MKILMVMMVTLLLSMMNDNYQTNDIGLGEEKEEKAESRSGSQRK